MENTFVTKYLNYYLDNIDQGYAKQTVINKTHSIKKLLLFLVEKDVDGFENFDINLVYEFINSLNYSSRTISLFEYNIRDFFNILYQNKLIDFDGYKVFPIIFTNKRDRIVSFYETEEIQEIIATLNPNSKNYVMHKCMVLLAAQMGLRASDILRLKLSEIKWDKNLIEKVQTKTGIVVSVPLPENLKFLLLDYMKNHRPAGNSEYVFLSKHSMDKYCDSELRYILSCLIKKSSVSVGKRKAGPHALRHSLATRLLKNNTPMPVITQILGHKNLNTTRDYLNIDIDSLRNMSLEV